MASQAPPTIFSNTRRKAFRRRMLAHNRDHSYVLDDMVDDVVDRLSFLRLEPTRSLVLGDYSFRLWRHLDPSQASVTDADIVGYFDHMEFDLEQPLPHGPYDFIACLGLLDTVNDLPGALLHIRNALAPGGLMIAQFVGAGSLPKLREAMLAADGERPAARVHPMVDVRAGGQLLQRCGFANPVIDSRHLDVRFSSLTSLVHDLRAQGLSNVLASPGPPLTRAALARAEAEFGSGTVERFEILTLSGWKR